MTVPGEYVIQAIYTDVNQKQVVQTITISKEEQLPDENCNIYITKDGEFEAKIDEAYGPQGGISVISNTNNVENIIDGNYNNYATSIRMVEILGFRPIAAITTNKKVNSEGKSVRVGFEVQALTGLLDLTAIETYKVKVYDGNTEINTGTDGSLLNVGVLNYDNSRVRLSINVNQQFDHIELWRDGVAGVLEAQRIYNVFYESTDCKEEGANEACMEVMTNVGHNLNIDYENTKVGEGIGAILGNLDNLENLLDASLDTYASFYTTVGLLSGATISLTFDEQPAKQPIGFVLGGNGDLISAEVLGGFSLTVFNGDTEVGSITDFTTADVNVISRNGKVYLEIPGEKLNSPYNRIELGMGDAVSALQTIYLRGVYTRVDSDGDGIPDCSEDQVSAGLTLSNEITHICEGEAASLKVVSTTFDDRTELNLVVLNSENNEEFDAEGILSNNSIAINGADKWSAGRYYIEVKQGEISLWNGAQLYIHPTETTWKKTNNSSTDWNNWDNWDNGSPWECTNVILPSDASIYPILKDEEDNMCHFIYFAPGAELVNTPAFSEDCPAKVFIDTNLEGGKYSLFSAPLNGMYTGDMFVSNTNPERFVSLNETTYPEQRFSPIIYQRFWSKTVEMVGVSENGSISDINIDQTDWSGTFNAVSTDYTPAQGFSIRPGKDGESGGYTFRFPKEHETYNFFYANGVATGDSRTIGRESVGKFIMDKYGSIDLSIKTSGTRFLLGNPFMTHLDIKEFLSENSTNVSSVEIYNGEQYVPITIGDNGVLISTLEQTPTTVAPMGAIFVKAKTAGTRLNVSLTRGMFHQKTGSTPAAFRSRSVSNNSSTQNDMLRINATVNGKTSSCVVLQSQSASDSYSSKEDISILIDNEVKPEVAVYTVAERKALAIQRIKSGKRIPLGLYLKQSGNVKLDFDNGSNFWEGWMLFDSKTGKKHSLRESIVFSNISSVSNRFYLIKE